MLGRAKASGRPDDAVLGLVEERVGRSLGERDALLSALDKNGVRVVQIDATRKVEEIRDDVLAVCRVSFASIELTSFINSNVVGNY